MELVQGQDVVVAATTTVEVVVLVLTAVMVLLVMFLFAGMSLTRNHIEVGRATGLYLRVFQV